MIPPMRAALTDHHADGNTVRQVVFLTDGASATNNNCSTRSRRWADARACSWW